MKKTLYIIFTTFMLSNTVVDTVWIDSAISKMNWIGYKVTGSHDGHVQIEKGYIVKQGDSIVGGEVVIDMQSITVADIKDIDKNGWLVSHLKNEDFFDVIQFPKAFLKILSSEEISSNDKANSNVIINGELTIKGITNKIAIHSHVDFISNVSRGQLIVDRTKWDIKYASNSFYDLGDRAIYDDFVINFLLFPNIK